ncbi:MAG: tRNA-dihydrouridine synthase, partial [Patescibacteria group bacterium]
ANFWKNLKKPITALAPMDEVTDYVFREIISEIAKPDVLFTEFTSADALFSNGHRRIARNLEYTERQRPIVAQLWGATPESLEEAAKYVQELRFDGVDINMGCPDKAIMKRSSGAALINNQPLVGEIISEVRKAAPDISLSIKTRLDKNPDLTKDWFSFLLSSDIDALIIHARTAKAMSKGKADWEEIGRAVELRDKINPKVTIIGNGDVKSYKEILEKHNKYNVDGIMIGRGILQNPWVFEKSENPQTKTKSDYVSLFLRHAELFHEKWGESKNFAILKKFAKMYIKGFKGSAELRQELMLTKSYDRFKDILNDI